MHIHILYIYMVKWFLTFCSQHHLWTYQAPLFIANFTSPSIVKSDITTCALKLMGSMVAAPNSAQNSCGLFLSPIFSYKPGNLYGEEYALLKSLSNSGCHVDSGFQLIFDIKSKTDSWTLFYLICLFPHECHDIMFLFVSVPFARTCETKGLWPTQAGWWAQWQLLWPKRVMSRAGFGRTALWPDLGELMMQNSYLPDSCCNSNPLGIQLPD